MQNSLGLLVIKEISCSEGCENQVGKFIKEEKLGVVMYRGDNLNFLEILLGEIMRWEVCEFLLGNRNDLVRLSARKKE